MQALTDNGQRTINDMASRYGVSSDAIMCMLQAVMNGGGTMAQFNCQEFGGGGQWMQGGMTMVGDMFNYGLKSSVDNVCGELSRVLQQQESIFVPVKKPQYSQGGQQQYSGQQQGNFGSGQQQSSGGGFQQQGQGSGMGMNSLFVSGGNFGNWWPDGLGSASSTGGQNNVRYAIFPGTHRLAVDINGQVTVYDTLDHNIGGVSQQQSGDSSVTFTSQYGLVRVADLPIVQPDGNVMEQQPISNPIQQQPQPNQQQPFQSDSMQSADSLAESDVFAAIEKLAGLKDKGYITDEEFSNKKSELLKRL